jgi:transposase
VVYVLSLTGLIVHVLIPFLIRKFMELNTRKGKTDKKDTLRIAQFEYERAELVPFVEMQFKSHISTSIDLSTTSCIVLIGYNLGTIREKNRKD